MSYKIGQFGRTVCEVLGVNGLGDERILPEGSLVEVCDILKFDDSNEPSGKLVRYCVVQRSESCEHLGDSAISYDGAWDGFLTDLHDPYAND